jgi:hypothetical protein
MLPRSLADPHPGTRWPALCGLIEPSTRPGTASRPSGTMAILISVSLAVSRIARQGAPALGVSLASTVRMSNSGLRP